MLPPELVTNFIRGIVVYLFLYLFLYEFQPVYQYGQNMVTVIFRFFSPLVKVAPFVLPIFSLMALVVFYFSTFIFRSKEIGYAFMFLVSFMFTMHMVSTAKALRSRDNNAAKPDYFFSISLIYAINIFILALMFDLILPDFSFPDFFKTATGMTGHIYKSAFNQLFVP